MKTNRKILVIMMVTLFCISLVPVAMADDGDKININTATMEQLTKLKRIGPKYAERIIRYREANGPFKTVQDITKVKGIGSKTLEENIDVMTVE